MEIQRTLNATEEHRNAFKVHIEQSQYNNMWSHKENSTLQKLHYGNTITKSILWETPQNK